MINIIFICVLGSITKEIKIDSTKGCSVLIDTKMVGSAKNDMKFCNGLATKVKYDMEKKSYKCEMKKI